MSRTGQESAFSKSNLYPKERLSKRQTSFLPDSRSFSDSVLLFALLDLLDGAKIRRSILTTSGNENL
jgi:hypothetical protein